MSSITPLHDRCQVFSPVQNVLDRLKGVRQEGAMTIPDERRLNDA